MSRRKNADVAARQWVEDLYRRARQIYFESLLRLGFTLIRLCKVKDDGDCTCSPFSKTRLNTAAKRTDYKLKGTRYPCGNAGKHPTSNAKQSVITSIKKIEDHLDGGGSVGICLRIEGLPVAPLRLVILDRDREGSFDWLRNRGIRSPLEVIGKRGGHDYMLLPDGVPDLFSDTSRLNPGRNNPVSDQMPGIDIKVSGLVVAAYSVNKTLYWEGRDISADPECVREIFESLDALRSRLPKFDPRSISPQMRIYDAEPMEKPEETDPDDDNRLDHASVAVHKRQLSAHRPDKDLIDGPLRGVRYSHRMNLAQRFARRTKPSESGHGGGGNTFRVVAAMLRHFWMSEADTLKLIKRHFGSRCLDENGEANPPTDKNLIDKIIWCRNNQVTDPIGRGNGEGFIPRPLTRSTLGSKGGRQRHRRSVIRRRLGQGGASTMAWHSSSHPWVPAPPTRANTPSWISLADTTPGQPTTIKAASPQTGSRLAMH